MIGANSIVIDERYIETCIPYNMKVSRYNKQATNLMKGYFYNEIKDQIMCYNEEDPEQLAICSRIRKYKTIEDVNISIEKLYKTKVTTINNNNIAKKKRRKIISWISPTIKCYDEEKKCLTYSTIVDIQYVGVLDIFRVIDDHDHKFYTTLYNRVLHYSNEFKRFYDLREGNILKCFDPWHDTPNNSQIVMIDNIGLVGSAYAIQLEKPTLHPIINGVIFKSAVFEEEEEHNNDNQMG